MQKGFFNTNKFSIKQSDSKIAKCGICELNKNCKSPKMHMIGNGKKKILIVREFPTKEEDQNKSPFSGMSTVLLKRKLREVGIELKEDCWLTYAMLCKPDKELSSIQLEKKVSFCFPNLLKLINKLKPNAILLVGKAAISSLITYAWKKDSGNINKWTGYCIPSQKLNCWLIPFFSVYMLHEDNPVIHILAKKYLKQLKQCYKKKPFEKIPDYQKEIDIELNPVLAAKFIKKVRISGKIFSFDYETNCLKPDIDDAKIYSCSISTKKKTVAFLWNDLIADEMSKLLKAQNKKIAANLKFEDRWTRAILKHPVKNWLWDTMIAAFVLDNSKGISSVKFQSFVRLGTTDYDSHIEPHLKSITKTGINKIHELNTKELLLYNGIDSLVEYQLYEKQRKYFKR